VSACDLHLLPEPGRCRLRETSRNGSILSFGEITANVETRTPSDARLASAPRPPSSRQGQGRDRAGRRAVIQQARGWPRYKFPDRRAALRRDAVLRPFSGCCNVCVEPDERRSAPHGSRAAVVTWAERSSVLVHVRPGTSKWQNSSSRWLHVPLPSLTAVNRIVLRTDASTADRGHETLRPTDERRHALS
jgi:hypothetical protein